ncbi:MAG: aldehyde dehydrogenase family protein [Pseudomonadota bacterium]
MFGASNFPLAFSVAGGDIASALAAGCPVIVKGHEAHPGTSEVVAKAVQAALAAEGLPAGTFALLQGPGPVTGAELVRHPAIKAVGFTGSTRAGRALYDLCAARPEPIPFYGELGSLNPVFLLPGALDARLEEIARCWAASVTMGAGQFCTNPSLVILPLAQAEAFAEASLTALSNAPAQPMLTDSIAAALTHGTEAAADRPGVSVLRHGGATGRDASPAILACDAEIWLSDEVLREEVFGPTALIVRANPNEMVALAHAMPGQLTATLHLEPSDHHLARRLLPSLEQAAGRILFDGFPTGVAVSDAIVHGGPWPASTNLGRSSVGTLAVKRWQRAVCWQDSPDHLFRKGTAA